MNRQSCTLFFLILLVYVFPCFSEPIVIGETVTIQSVILDEERTLMISLPNGYEGSQAVYPVLYLLDAGSNFHHTTGQVQTLARTGHIPRMIVVAVVNTDRNRDLTPSRQSADEETGEVAMPTTGGADNFLRFFREELIPWVDENHRTAPYRILVGHSFGGLFAVHTLVSAPDLFDAYIAISPSLQWEDGETVDQAEALITGGGELRGRLFMTIADEGREMLTNCSRLAELLEYRGSDALEWDFRIMEGDDHGSVPIRSTYLGLRAIFPRWSAPQFILEDGLPGLERHYARLSADYGYPIQIPETTINLLGYRALAEDEIDEAIRIFEINVERYPASANVYDSLAEAQEQGGKLAAALTNYERAYKRGEEVDDPNTTTFRTNYDRVKEQLAERE